MQDLKNFKNIMTGYFKKHNLQEMFGTLAPKYDKINGILSLGTHHLWNRVFIRMLGSADHLLDLCSGTGKVALSYVRTYPGSSATLIDFSSEMLQIAKKRAPQNVELTFLHRDVSTLPLESSSQTLASMAYGLRNLSEKTAALKEVFRVLKPGGRFGILELTQARGLLHSLHSCYLKIIVPKIGKFFSHHPNAYQYLSESIHNLPKDHELEQLFLQAGFQLKKKNKFFSGVATIWLLEKTLKSSL
ncbi:ubiquinone/menaquinone biosynthesis methyltransferase [Chlamydia pecorum MC/MarsBar]|nr:ubiquinone/menaquinone biosynthesis methyltransferase [Chlamydia pecorum MC/MarsBar]UBV32066.1 ubiquinone/menaquinone biosynthesis methyltransferase [Chlamydia pecorum]